MSDKHTLLQDELRRLERKLAREQAARQEAETIAEQGTRELYEGKRRLRLLEAIAAAANTSSAPSPTFALALRLICEFTHWPVGHFYFLPQRRGKPLLVSSRIWHMEPGYDLAAFAAASRGRQFEAGAGLPGRVLESGQSIWIRDLQAETNFLRGPEAQAAGLRAAFAFPVTIDGQVAAVMEFFADRVSPPDAAVLEVMAQVGVQLGWVIERTRANRDLRRNNGALRAAIAEAQAQRLAAEAASRAKSAFLAVTSHEVRTPMNAVLGMAQALAREPLDARQRELVDGVIDGGALLLRLLNAVLDISRVEQGEQVVEHAPYDLRRTLAGVHRMWRLRAEELGVHLHLDLDGLPRECLLVSDEGKLEQTLVNLVSNALKFTPAGGAVTTVAAFAAAAPGRARLRIEVVDQGQGVPEADRERIFQAFEQTQAGRDAGGIGLGLAICAGNLAALGGTIGQDRTARGENRFWLEFEAELADPTALEKAGSAPPAAVERPLRVLAAEDNPANRRVLEVLLQPLGVELVFANDGREAVAAAAAAPYDLILMDANMPRLDGVEAVKVIRGRRGPCAQVPIWMLTANVFEEDLRRYHDAGADGVLKKPIEFQMLIDVLSAVAGGGLLRAA